MKAIAGSEQNNGSAGHGGKRDGAGRKPTRDKFALEVEQAETLIASDLTHFAQNLRAIADGNNSGIKEEWVAAGTVMVDRVLTYKDLDGRDTGQPYQDKSGKPMTGKQPAFPHLEPTDMVCVKRFVLREGMDKLANMYLLDRIAGKAAPNRDEPIEFDPVTVLDALGQIGDLVEAFVTDPDAQTQIAKRLRGIAESLSQAD